MLPKVLAVSMNYSNFKMPWLSTNLIKSSSVVLKHLKRSVSLNFKIITMGAAHLVVFLTNRNLGMIVTGYEHENRSDPSHRPARLRQTAYGGEVRLLTPGQSFLVDGYDTTTKTVYGFHGCLWHGCPLCFPRRDQYSKLNRDRTFQEMYEATVCKHTMLEHAGHKLVHIWEYQWDKQLDRDSDLRSFVSSLSLPTPLEPRDAFFGGRTNAAALYYKTDTSIREEIKYMDVTSLYPFINTTGRCNTSLQSLSPRATISLWKTKRSKAYIPPLSLLRRVRGVKRSPRQELCL